MLPGVDSAIAHDKQMRIVFQKPNKTFTTTLHLPQTAFLKNNLDLRAAMTKQEQKQHLELMA